MLDPRIAHHIDARILLAHLHQASQSDLFEIRREFARYLTTRRTPRGTEESWQDAWNEWTGATPHQPGQVRFHTPRCPECKGRGFSTRNVARNFARTGNPYVCPECRGTRRGKWVTVTATHIRPPQTDAPTSASSDNNGAPA